MTPDLSYCTNGREAESSGRVIYGIGQKKQQKIRLVPNATPEVHISRVECYARSAHFFPPLQGSRLEELCTLTPQK